jgi:hypothetical protein
MLDASMLCSCAQKKNVRLHTLSQHLRRHQMLLAFSLPESDVKINLHAFTPAAKFRSNHPVYMTEKEINNTWLFVANHSPRVRLT